MGVDVAPTTLSESLPFLTDTSSLLSQTHFPDGGQPVPVQLPDAVDSQPQQSRQVGIPDTKYNLDKITKNLPNSGCRTSLTWKRPSAW